MCQHLHHPLCVGGLRSGEVNLVAYVDMVLEVFWSLLLQILLHLMIWSFVSEIDNIIIYLFFIRPSTCPFIHLSIYPSIYPSIHSFICPFINPFIHPFIHQSIHLSVPLYLSSPRIHLKQEMQHFPLTSSQHHVLIFLIIAQEHKREHSDFSSPLE